MPGVETSTAPRALRRARIDAGLTQQALADRVGVARPRIARWEAGGRVPKVETAVRLARELGTTVEAIWTPLTPELFIEGSVWVLAKTTQDHEYTVKAADSKAPAMSPDSFEWFVAYIREHGYPAKYGRQTYIYLEVGEWRYWTMGWPVEQTKLINRARIDEEPTQNPHNGGSGQVSPGNQGVLTGPEDDADREDR